MQAISCCLITVVKTSNIEKGITLITAKARQVNKNLQKPDFSLNAEIALRAMKSIVFFL